jgi:hypothetical protein
MIHAKPKFVLVQPSTVATGKPRYFRAMTSMGPACTLQLRDAAKFPTEAAAKLSPAYGRTDVTLEPKAVS